MTTVACYDRYFNDRLSVLTEFLPQTVFLLSIFGYLILLIVYKWFAYDANMSPCAPSLLIGESATELCLLIGQYHAYVLVVIE